MKVGIDTFGLDHGESGLGAYLFYLMKNLSPNDDIQFELFGHESDRYTYKANFDVEYTAVDVDDSIKAQKSWHFWKANSFILSRKYDVVIFCAAIRMLPRKIKTKSIAIVNDLVSQSEDLVKIKRLKQVNKIIVPTKYVKDELVNFGVVAEKIVVISNGIDHSLFYQHNLLDNDYVNIKPFAIKKPYIIYPTRISDLEKNHVQLIEAFNIFKKKTGLPHRLVLAGSQDDYAETLQDVVLSSEYASDIFMTGFFPHKELGSLYSNAEACIFPSSKEGVGLPIIETMASGIPVACANKAALPEMAGGNAVLFDPNNVEQIAQAIEKVIVDTTLRQSLIQKGMEWAATFTWQSVAVKIQQLILNI
jgi:glycosyltransferase involved in cell wall biosynthesis